MLIFTYRLFKILLKLIYKGFVTNGFVENTLVIDFYKSVNNSIYPVIAFFKILKNYGKIYHWF